MVRQLRSRNQGSGECLHNLPHVSMLTKIPGITIPLAGILGKILVISNVWQNEQTLRVPALLAA